MTTAVFRKTTRTEIENLKKEYSDLKAELKKIKKELKSIREEIEDEDIVLEARDDDILASKKQINN